MPEDSLYLNNTIILADIVTLFSICFSVLPFPSHSFQFHCPIHHCGLTTRYFSASHVHYTKKPPVASHENFLGYLPIVHFMCHHLFNNVQLVHSIFHFISLFISVYYSSLFSSQSNFLWFLPEFRNEVVVHLLFLHPKQGSVSISK